MKHKSNEKFTDPPVGATVRVPLPDVNRDKIDARSVLIRIMAKTDDSGNNFDNFIAALSHKGLTRV